MPQASYPTIYCSCVDGKPYVQVGLKIKDSEYDAICRFNALRPEYLQLQTTHPFDEIERRRRHVFVVTFYPRFNQSLRDIFEQSVAVMTQAVNSKEYKEAMRS